MLGWQIRIYPETGLSNPEDRKAVVHWLTGLDGTQWLDRMVIEQKAVMLGSNGGYPLRYSARWKDLLPELLMQPEPYNGPPVIGEDYVMTQGWQSQKKVNHELLAQRQPDDLMIVDAWDQS